MSKNKPHLWDYVPIDANKSGCKKTFLLSRSARSAWIETLIQAMGEDKGGKSRSARSAWIETREENFIGTDEGVALRKECVD